MVQTTHISNLNGMGTFAYAAPELLTGGKCNEVADIFSFGVLLWELVTGEMPRRGKLRDLRRAPRAASHDLTDAHTPTPQSTGTHKGTPVEGFGAGGKRVYMGSGLLDTSDGTGGKTHAV